MRSGVQFPVSLLHNQAVTLEMCDSFYFGVEWKWISFRSFTYLCFMSTAEIEEQIVSRLKPINPDRIILFGSLVYGKPDKNSDLDLCVIADSSRTKSQMKRRIRSLLKGIPIAKDILTPSIGEYDFYRNEVGSVYMEIDKKGKILWQSS